MNKIISSLIVCMIHAQIDSGRDPSNFFCGNPQKIAVEALEKNCGGGS